MISTGFLKFRKINAEQICLLFLSLSLFFAAPSFGAQATWKVQGAWVELKAAPLFEAERVKLSPMWGVSLPNGAKFEPERAFGRWVYGQLEPLRYMKKKDFAPKGWIYNRFLIPNDDTAAGTSFDHLSHVYFHGNGIWPVTPELKTIRFLESLALSRKSFEAYRSQDEATSGGLAPLPKETGVSGFLHFLPPLALAAEPTAVAITEAKASKNETAENTFLGLSGSSFEFLNQEIKVQEEKRAKLRAKEFAETLRAPIFKPLNGKMSEGILARYILTQQYAIPGLSQFEVDGHLYMRAVAQRALEGCTKEIQSYWSKNNWSIFRIYSAKQGKSGAKNPWLQEILPDGVFVVSSRAISTANNEAEMAFILIRAMVQKFFLDSRHSYTFPKNFSTQIANLASEELDRSRKLHNLKDSASVDISDVLKIDMASIDCIAKAGYSARTTLEFLKRMEFERKTEWAQGYFDFFMGNAYRLEQFRKLVTDKLAAKEIPETLIVNSRRFQESQRQWNIMP